MRSKTVLALILSVFFSGSATLAASPNYAKLKYEQLGTPEMRVFHFDNENPVVGSRVDQKNDPNGGFCRKITATVPNAQPTYACYTLLSDDSQATALYENSDAAELRAIFYIGKSPLIGSRWNEKVVSGANFGIETICVKTSAVVPNPAANYKCYENAPSIGGGVSVGN